MENKTTTELLDLLEKSIDKDGNLSEDWSDIYDELITRTPFNEIFGDEGLEEKIEDLEEEVKLLKRHKHDDKSNDVLIRI